MKILIVLTGGTIGSTVSNSVIDVTDSSVYRLIDMYNKRYNNDVEFEVHKPINILSENLDLQHWNILCKFLSDIDYSNYDGIIITHGSDTLPYTSALIGYCFNTIDIPIVITASNYELSHPNSNGLHNFNQAIMLIRNVNKGVYTIYKNNNNETVVYIPTRLKEADIYTGEFSSFGQMQFGYMINNKLITEIDSEPLEEIYNNNDNIDIANDFSKNTILVIKPYPGLDYSNIKLTSSTKAVLHIMYHSSTACIDGDRDKDLRVFIERCRNSNIDVYGCSFNMSNSDRYASSKELLETGLIPLNNICMESAYVKLVLAYNQSKVEPIEIMKRNIYFEHIKISQN